jgi:phosphoglycolate phosphatase-like HAD superfamily hydrolase
VADFGVARPSPVGLYLFDVDGTLVPSSPVHGAAFDYALKSVYGTMLTIAGIEGEGRTDAWILSEPLRRAGWPEDRIMARFPQAFAAMVDYFNRHVGDSGGVVLPGVPDLLRGLQADDQLLGVITGNLEGIAMSKLRRAGLASFFPAGAFGEVSFQRGDLVPVAITNVCRTSGHDIPKERIVVVGDTPLDVEAGRENGVCTAVVATGMYSQARLQATGADLVIPSFADWSAALNGLLTLIRDRKKEGDVHG